MPPDVTASAVPRVRTPVEEKLDVALPPKYAVPVLEKSVEDALAKDWRAVQMLACPRFKVAVKVPPRVAGVPPMVSVALESERAM